MSDSKPKWSSDGKKIPEIDLHTKAKHQIIEKYIERLILKLYAETRFGETKFTFIDGFSGGGIYRDPETNKIWAGSPIRIINAVREGYKKSNRNYTEPLHVRYIFIDASKSNLTCLKNHAMGEFDLESLTNQQPHTYKYKEEFVGMIEQCEFFHGEFEKLLNMCILKVEAHTGHSFFLLDPFGWTDVSMDSFRKINSLKKSEILYTYMIDYIKRFLSERYTSQKNNFQTILEADDYYKDAKLEDSSIGQQCYLRDQSIKLFYERGKGKYIFTFSLIPKGQHIVLYYLIHMSQNLTAVEVMKDCFEFSNNLEYQYHYEIYGYGFKTAEYYNDNQLNLELNISQDSYEFCLSKLDGDVGKLISQNPDGIRFKDILNTMHLNPANRNLYNEYINRSVNEKEIEIWRKDILLKGTKIKLRKDDVIKVVKTYQTSFLYSSKFLPK